MKIYSPRTNYVRSKDSVIVFLGGWDGEGQTLLEFEMQRYENP